MSEKTVRAVLDDQLGDLPLDRAQIARAADVMVRSLVGGGKLLAFGNGGSAACAQHLTSEFVGRMSRERPAMAAIALTTDTSLITAVANDFGFERIFSRQIEALGRPGDVAFGISTSGRSPNVVAGLALAASTGLSTIALGGPEASPMDEHADVSIHVLDRDVQRIQELHLAVQHALCAAVENAIWP